MKLCKYILLNVKMGYVLACAFALLLIYNYSINNFQKWNIGGCMTYEEFKKSFIELKKQGFVRSQRRGPTGVGYTFETLLNINENNLSFPDIENIEIKAHRNDANNLITLFTFNRKAWIMKPLEAIKKYGSRDKDGRLGLYYTLDLTPNSRGLFLNVQDDKIKAQHISGQVVAEWRLDVLAERFEQKIPALLFVSAHSEQRGGEEYFHYYRAQIMRDTSADLLSDLFRSKDLVVDLRLHDAKTRARNHGTGFRVFEDKLPKLFRDIKDIS